MNPGFSWQLHHIHKAEGPVGQATWAGTAPVPTSVPGLTWPYPGQPAGRDQQALQTHQFGLYPGVGGSPSLPDTAVWAEGSGCLALSPEASAWCELSPTWDSWSGFHFPTEPRLTHRPGKGQGSFSSQRGGLTCILTVQTHPWASPLRDARFTRPGPIPRCLSFRCVLTMMRMYMHVCTCEHVCCGGGSDRRTRAGRKEHR